jgi:hypothetical protein
MPSVSENIGVAISKIMEDLDEGIDVINIK